MDIYQEFASKVLFILQTTLQGVSALDSTTHRLLTALSNAKPGKNAEQTMADADMACRKLASQHPVLVLRYAI